ncbi:hypothetical protein EVA_14138 [gut metagenome]|uniref:Uncharacterized protein n=1 Tax=gut metagenome TaxID=749906 RepID=J9GEG2_9ZZZZ
MSLFFRQFIHVVVPLVFVQDKVTIYFVSHPVFYRTSGNLLH